ncbi:hypothetical protein LSTR_LSTR015429 [Laodelphax striatellus]|uniref:Uncharacterized protein n=1 Tax=Laodelphax striatellus TaxID=195883 RepID=A0A482X9R5_LAOST|nr:hypothetical protein LSTR_LSTR015429 [Laodelphax striatellus]
MQAMGEQMKSIPLFGSVAAPLMNLGVQLTGMPRGLTASGFNMGRQGFNGLFGLFGVPAGSTKNSLKPEYSESRSKHRGGYQR